MKNGRTAVTAVVVLFLSSFLLLPRSFAAGTVFWKVTSKTATVYLLGSIHVATPALYPLPERMEQAFARSNCLVVEANTAGFEDGTALLGLVTSKGMHLDGGTLQDDLPPDVYSLFLQECTRCGLEPGEFLAMKPWMAAIVFSQKVLQSDGFDPNCGIDMHFLAEANGVKEVRELESVEYQLNLFASLDLPTQALLLKQAVLDNRDAKGEVSLLLQAWKEGDGERIARESDTAFATGGAEFAPLRKVLFSDRNRQMATKIEGYLAGADTCFVVVGAGHLAGQDGIVALLKQKGYAVTNDFAQ